MLEDLKKIGLSQNEAKVYLALLEIGSSTAQTIAQKSELKRPTTYVQLESLMKRGLVSSFERNAKTLFRAEDPEHLHKVLEKEKEEQKLKAEALEQILPGLGNLYLSAGERPRVRFFEDIEGLKTIQDEILKTKEKLIKAVTNADDVLKLFPQHAKNYIPKRVQRGIRSKIIYTSSEGDFLKSTDKEMLRESKFIESSKMPFSGDMLTYGQNVVISVVSKKQFGIIIESEEIAKSFGAIFDLLWEKI
ncbi:MAG: helix-turn-helix domain-containing protein [Patescibacteria group bacterium]